MTDMVNDIEPVRQWRNAALNRQLTQQQHLDLIALHHSVPTELVLDLLVPGATLLLLGTHSAAHLAGNKMVSVPWALSFEKFNESSSEQESV